MSNLDSELKAINEALSVVQVLGLIQRLGALAEAAISKGDTHVSPEDMAASVGGDDASLYALRNALR